jgi:dephospho-CoA kinase
LGELGGEVIDADVLAREATAPGAATLEPIRRRFGGGVFRTDGSLDRSALATIVFADPAALAELEAIVHPAVRVRAIASLERATAEGRPFVVIEAIKLVEGGLAARCDEVWLVECDPAEQRRRLLGRGMAESDLARRLRLQGPDLAERLGPKATRRISTNGSPDEVRRRVEAALGEALAAKRDG